MEFYVYLHSRQSDGRIFYVGKGKRNRAWSTYRRNKHWMAVANKHGWNVTIFAKNLEERKAFEVERALITSIGKDNLTNFTDGGEGPSGYIFTPEQISKLSAAQTGRKHPDTVKSKIAAAHIGMKTSEETKRKLSALRTGITLSEDHRQKITKSLQGNQRARNSIERVFYHREHGQFIGDMREFELMTNEHPTKLITAKKLHIKGWVYLGQLSI